MPLRTTPLGRLSQSTEQVQARFGISADAKPADGDTRITQQIQREHQIDFRRQISNTAAFIHQSLEDGREKEQALLHLEAALMWANKGIYS